MLVTTSLDRQQVLLWGSIKLDPYDQYSQSSESLPQISKFQPLILIDQPGLKDINGFDSCLFVLTKDGRVLVMGKDPDFSGCLGLGSTKETKKLVSIPFQKQIVQLECGNSHTVVRDIEGNLLVWGTGYEGQLGFGQRMVFANLPSQMTDCKAELVRCISNNTIYSEGNTIWLFGYYKDKSNYQPVEIWSNSEEQYSIKDFVYRTNLLLIYLKSAIGSKLVIIDLKCEHFNEVQTTSTYLGVRIIQKHEFLLVTHCKTLLNKSLYSYEHYKLHQNADLEKLQTIENVKHQLHPVSFGTQGYILVLDEGEVSDDEQDSLTIKPFVLQEQELRIEDDKESEREEVKEEKNYQQPRQKRSTSLMKNFVQFAQRQQENKLRRKYSALEYSEGRGGSSSFVMTTPRHQPNIQKVQHMQYTPVIQKNHSQFALNTCKLTKQSQYSEEDRDFLFQSISQRLDTLESKNEEIIRRSKASQGRLTPDQLQLIEKGNILKLKTFVHVIKNKINYVCGQSFLLMKENDKTKKKQIAAIKYLLTTQAYKEYLLETQSYFNQWKQYHQRGELMEQIGEMDDDLTIEKSKLILIRVFQQLSFKSKMQDKIYFWQKLQRYCKQIKQLKKCVSIQNRQYLRKSIYVWNKKKRELTQTYQNINLLISRIKKVEQKQKLRALYKIIVKASQFKPTNLQTHNLTNSIIEEAEDESGSEMKPKGEKYSNQSLNGNIIISYKTSTNILQPVSQSLKSQRHYYQQTKEDYQQLKYLQRMVHSTPSVHYDNPLKQKLSKHCKDIFKPKKKVVPQTIEINYEDNEALFLERTPSSQLNNCLNDSSLLPLEDKRRSSTYNKNLQNLSQIVKNNNNTEIIDEEEQQMLNRLMMKYLKENTTNQVQSSQAKNLGNNTNTTINFNSTDTLLPFPQSATSQYHKKLNSMVQIERSGFNQDRYMQGSSKQEKFLNIVDLNTPREEEKQLSFITSPKSPKSIHIPLNLIQQNNYFNDQKDHSISVSKIEEVPDEQNYQSRVDLNDFSNDDDDEFPSSHTKNRREDFSFSMEKEKQGKFSQTLSPSIAFEPSLREKKLKNGNSRNNYQNQIKSKQYREKLALNELTSVLNQQQQSKEHVNQLRLSQGISSPLGGGQTYYLLEQETANFNKGDWHCRSPLQSTFQNINRPVTRNSINTADSKIQRRFSSSNQNSPSVMHRDFGVRRQSMKISEDHKSSDYLGRIQLINMSAKSSRKNKYEEQENGSPGMDQACSFYANFSNDLLSPGNYSKRQSYLASLKKAGLNNSNNNLDYSSNTTFAQQSAFEQFRQKINDNMNKIGHRKISMDRGMETYPHSMRVSPQKKYQGEKEIIQYLETLSEDQNDQSQDLIYQVDTIDMFQKHPQQLLRIERTKQSVNMDYVDPAELGSVCNSLNNMNGFQSQRSSIQNNCSRPVSSIFDRQQIINEQNTIQEEDGDVTIRQSQDQENQQQVSRIEYDEYDDCFVPVLQFDIQQVGALEGEKEEINKESSDQEQEFLNNNNQHLNFILNTQGSTQSQGFYKKTMSHNDLVQLGTMEGQHQLTQRSYSNQVFLTNDQIKNAQEIGGQQNKFLDAFKQYEAEKVKKRRTDVAKSSSNNSFHDNQSLSQSLIIPQLVPMTQSYNHTGPIYFQNYEEEFTNFNSIPRDNYATQPNHEEIKEMINEEEDESIIFIQNQKKGRHQESKSVESFEATRHETQGSKFETQLMRGKANNSNSFVGGKRQPKEVKINLEIKKQLKKDNGNETERVEKSAKIDDNKADTKLIAKLIQQQKTKPPLKSQNTTPKLDKNKSVHHQPKHGAKYVAYNEMKKTRSIIINHLLGNSISTNSGSVSKAQEIGSSFNSKKREGSLTARLRSNSVRQKL